MKRLAFSLFKEFIISLLTDMKVINYIKDKFLELVNKKRKEIPTDEQGK